MCELKMLNKIVDFHMHVVPSVDDGSRSVEESLQMLRLASEQGVTDVFCTSHNGYGIDDSERYLTSFSSLQSAVDEAKINIKIHKGCEILCSADYINDTIYSLNRKAFFTMGDTRYVLVELYYDVELSEALTIVKSLIKNGYKPIIAHVERYFNITAEMVRELVENGALIQVNAFSFVDESDSKIRERARMALDNMCVHFIGSDAHRMNHRPPSVKSGIKYILENTDSEYANLILSGRMFNPLDDEGL